MDFEKSNENSTYPRLPALYYNFDYKSRSLLNSFDQLIETGPILFQYGIGARERSGSLSSEGPFSPETVSVDDPSSADETCTYEVPASFSYYGAKKEEYDPPIIPSAEESTGAPSSAEIESAGEPSSSDETCAIGAPSSPETDSAGEPSSSDETCSMEIASLPEETSEEESCSYEKKLNFNPSERIEPDSKYQFLCEFGIIKKGTKAEPPKAEPPKAEPPKAKQPKRGYNTRSRLGSKLSKPIQFSDYVLSQPSTSSQNEVQEEEPKLEKKESKKRKAAEGVPASKKICQSEAAGDQVDKPVPTEEKSTYRNYPKGNLDRAVLGVLEGTLNITSAAKQYQVPSRTVYDKLQNLRDAQLGKVRLSSSVLKKYLELKDKNDLPKIAQANEKTWKCVELWKYNL